ncbi:hypothetical protein [Rhodopseudomonas parapalustris]
MFKFRDKKQIIGTVLGAICFLPTYVIGVKLGAITNLGIGLWIVLLSQALWLTSIYLCTWSLDIENRKLKKQNKVFIDSFMELNDIIQHEADNDGWCRMVVTKDKLLEIKIFIDLLNEKK